MNKSIPAMIVFLLLTVAAFQLIPEPALSEKKTPSGSGGYSYIDGKDPDPKVDCDFQDIKLKNDADGYSPNNYNDVITVDLPFVFTFYGKKYDEAYVSARIAMSFESNSGFSDYYYHRSIPNAREPNALLAVYWGYDYAYDWSNPDKKTIFTLDTTQDGMRVFIIQWEGRQGTLCQAMLFQGGMIKYQYQSAYASGGVGSYAIIGIENSQGSQGIGYSDYEYRSDDLFTTPFAIAFVMEDMVVYDTELENGDGVKGDVIHAGAKYYRFTTRISHSDSADSIKVVKMRLAPWYEKIDFTFFKDNETFIQESGMTFATIHEEGCGVEVVDQSMIVTFSIDFRISYPSEEPRNVSIISAGLFAVPAVNEVDDLYRVENDLEWNMNTVFSETQGGRVLKDNSWVAGGETVIFTGLKIVYENSDQQPRPTLAQVSVKDNYGTEKTVFIPRGNWMEVSWNAVRESAQMKFVFSMVNVDYENKVPDLSEDILYNLTVDTIKPEAVSWITTYADGLEEDEETSMDNDQLMFLQWGNSSDGGMSGVVKYLVEARSGDFILKKEISQSDWSPNTENFIRLGRRLSEALPEGIINISIKAVDLVGNLGETAYTTFMVDLHGPSFELVDPKPGEWMKSKTPEITIRASDELSGVAGKNMLSRYSRDGGISWNEWEIVKDYQTGKEIEFNIEPSLVEGENNRVQVKGQDIALSEETISDEFSVWVDARAPNIEISDHVVDENGTIQEWLEKPNDPLTFRIHDWKGSGLDMNNIFYRFSKDNGSSFSADTPLSGEPYNNTKGYQEIEVDINKNWLEGTGNILIIEATDKVGRTTIERFRIKLDTTPEFVIVKPVSGRRYLDNESIPFEVRYNDQDGNEDVEVRWISSIDGEKIPMGPEDEFLLSAGEHTITMILEDGVHVIRKSFPLTVLDHVLQMPEFKDTDGDGMNDSYELQYGLNPEMKDADQDNDNDGYTNLEEFYSGTDPTDSNIYPSSTIVEENFPVGTLVLMVVGILLFLLAAILMIMELRKEPQKDVFSPPPPPYTQQGLQQGAPQNQMISGTGNIPQQLPPASSDTDYQNQ
mgnify:CR=1 FL=1